MSFTAAPTSERTTGVRTVDLSDTAVLRFDPASATGTNEPCAMRTLSEIPQRTAPQRSPATRAASR